jgi:hypothetical protein
MYPTIPESRTSYSFRKFLVTIQELVLAKQVIGPLLDS